jgi:xanthine/uracil/vitamin C permease (AzgA family)
VSYQEALAAVFVESFIFMFISLVGLRGRLIELVPKHIMLATAVGIGLFLAHIGFQHAEGMGLITYDPATLVTLGELQSFQWCLAITSLMCANALLGNNMLGNAEGAGPWFVQSCRRGCNVTCTEPQPGARL